MYIYTIYQYKEEKKEILMALIGNLEATQGIEDKDNTLEVYADWSDDFEKELTEIKSTIEFEFNKEILDNKNWNEVWENSFDIVVINEKIGIRATFHEPIQNVEREIVIQPKMSFGTGHHATTAQMMRAMQTLDFEQKKVLDLGSGTAILSVYAEMLGSNEVLAIDNDPWCYENAKENILLNQAKNIKPKQGNIEDVLDQQYEIILANIHKNYHIEHLKNYNKIVKKGGYIILSGFYESDSLEILNKSLEQNLIANYYTAEENWACIILQKTTT